MGCQGQAVFCRGLSFFVKTNCVKKILCSVVFAGAAFMAKGQTDSVFSMQFEDVDSKPVKRYATQKIPGQIPNRFISIGYEYQGGHDFSALPAPFPLTQHFTQAAGLRLAFAAPVVSTQKWIVNLVGSYWRTAYAGKDYSFPYPLYRPLKEAGLHSAGLSVNVFKPLNEKHFIYGQFNTDLNWMNQGKNNLDKDALTLSGNVIFGWKKSENTLWGLGISRTYRLGRPLIIPILLYNTNFNAKWGLETAFPARAFLRRNLNKQSMLLAGYELEGNQYALYNGILPTTFLQRGEIKPRISYERSLYKFWWIAIQTGLRVNGRFNVTDRYNGEKENEIIRTTLGNAFYFNVSLNLVSL
ncbi:MAG: hypothetical protein EAZ62_05160 [Sphingobacteriia bacterium]|nr:MAG: hypothetical protein EAZ62_05160 [Sphingobacteriia bacterium]